MNLSAYPKQQIAFAVSCLPGRTGCASSAFTMATAMLFGLQTHPGIACSVQEIHEFMKNPG